MAHIAMKQAGEGIIERPNGVKLCAEFYFQRPKSLKKAIVVKSTKPDTDKLLRSLSDSLIGIVYEDDSQVCEAHVMKLFGSPERVEVRISKL